MNREEYNLLVAEFLLYNLDFVLSVFREALGNSGIKILKSETMTTRYGGFRA
jgi:hypothetical protein